MNALKMRTALSLTFSKALSYRGLTNLTCRGRFPALSTLIRAETNFYTPALSSTLRLFHSSNVVCAKKKGGKKDSDSDDDVGGSKPSVELPKVKMFEGSMDNTVKWILGELAKIKVGAITADMFANISLPGTSYGTVGKAGQVVMKTSSKLVVSVFDPTLTNAVADALKSAGFNLNPTIEGNNVLATIPRPSKEAREQMIANASKMAEKAKLDVRNVRKRGLDEAKKAKNSVSEDDFRRFGKELEAATEKKIETISNAFKAKEKEILSASA
eukprot:gene22277-27240_t